MIYDMSKMDEEDVHSISLSSVRSYIYYHDSIYYQPLVNELLQKTEGKWEKAVKWFISNSARAVKKNALGFKVSFKGEVYTNNKLGIGFRGVKSLLEWLEQKGYIDIYKGYVMHWKVEGKLRSPERVFPSVVKLRPRALEMWQGLDDYDLWKDIESESCVEVKSRSTKEVLEDFIVDQEVIEKVMNYNNGISGANIKFKGRQIADVEYKRVFIENMEIAGRLYAQGGGVQLLPQKIRSEHLTIDDEPVVELDYSAIHPNISYQMLYNSGVNVYDVFGDDFHPYNADLSFVEVDENLKNEIEGITGVAHNPLRQLTKLAILVGINSKDIQQAVSAMSSKVFEDRKKEKKDQQFYAIPGTIPVKKILEAVQEHNGLIEDSFFSDKGIVYQNVDSNIMMGIVERMVQKGHDVLAYHDSCLCKKSAEEDLRAAMMESWMEVLGDSTFCMIERK